MFIVETVVDCVKEELAEFGSYYLISTTQVSTSWQAFVFLLVLSFIRG